MKSLWHAKALRVLFVANLFLTSCSDDDPQGVCYQEDNRKIVTTVENVRGTIVFRESCDFLIDPDEILRNNPVRLLSPCNLTDEFQVEDSRVLFSGYIYESFETEDICADFFELTEISFSAP